jgi:cytochrome P450
MPFSPSEAAAIARTFDLKALPADFFDNPFDYYRALREHAPVKRQADGSIVLTRYADIEAVYKDTATFSSDKKLEFGAKYGQSPLYEHHTTSLVFNDPPLHTRVRRILTGALSPRAIAAMEPSLVALVDGLLDRAAAKGKIDLVEDFASAVPIEVIGNLLGVPHEERGPLRGWSLAILGALEHVLTPEQMARGNSAVTAFLAYLVTLIAARRRTLRDPDQDVLSRLIIGDAGGEQLTAKELLHNCIFLLNAGHETTTNLIGNGLVALAQWPGERARLVADASLSRTAVEEILRFESSNQLGNRITTRATRIGDVELSPQTPVHLVIGAANRDPERFPDPDTFDIARDPNRHLAFASGPHQCVGMTLARLEGRIAIGRFVARFPHYRLTAPPLRSRRARFRGFTCIPASTG